MDYVARRRGPLFHFLAFLIPFLISSLLPKGGPPAMPLGPEADQIFRGLGIHLNSHTRQSFFQLSITRLARLSSILPPSYHVTHG